MVKPGFFETISPTPIQQEHCHFRKRRTTTAALVQKAIAHGALFDSIVSYVTSRLKLPKVNFPEMAVNSLADVELAAEKCRQEWGLGLIAPIANMVRVAENAGAVVTYFPGVSDKVDALSVSRPRPIIVRSEVKESCCRLRFDIAHEIGHLVMHQGIETGDIPTEEQANRFASAFLLPRAGFVREYPKFKRVDWDAVFELKLRWKVSARAIVRRSYDLGMIDALEYRRANIFLSKNGQAKIEKYDRDIPLEEPEVMKKCFSLLLERDRLSLAKMPNILQLRPELIQQVCHNTVSSGDIYKAMSEFSNVELFERANDN